MDAVVEEIAEMEVTNSNSSPEKIAELEVSPDQVDVVLEEPAEQEVGYNDIDIKYRNSAKWNLKQRSSYSSAWERNIEFRDWVGKHPADPCRAICRYCSCTLRAHKTDLKKHMSSNKHKRNQRTYDRCGASALNRKYGIPTVTLKREPNLEMDDPSCSIFNEGLGALHSDSAFMADEQDEFPITDGHIKSMVNKVGEAFCRDLLRLLRRQKPLVKGLQRSEFSKGEEGVDRMTRLLVAHLAQHYLVESTLDSWRRGGTMTDNMANKLAHVEDRMEKYVLEIRNMKLQLESESGRGPAGVTLDTLDLSDLQKTSATINIVGT